LLLTWPLVFLGLRNGTPSPEERGGQGSSSLIANPPSDIILQDAGLHAAQDTVPARSRRLDRLHRQPRIVRDTTGAIRDSLGRIIGYGHAIPTDSTARLKHFTYKREDSPEVAVFPRRTHPLFLRSPASIYTRQVSLDSTGTKVIIRETVGEKDVKIPLVVPLSDYIRLSYAYATRQGLEELAYKYKMKEEKDELSQLLGSVTNIEIPIPPNPILSLFGGRGINLHISGVVDIHAGFRNQQTQQATISRLGNVRNEPDFNQDVQINVSGTVGEKLNINADWNTQRVFEYENSLKIKYTGYDDEIVQSVEAGNVSLATPASFIGSSQALFGFKAAMQMGPLRLTTVASQKKGQTNEFTVSGGSQAKEFELKAYQYSTNHFFLDTLYRRQFSPYYDNFVPVINPNLQVVDIEVWVTRLGQDDPNERDVVAYINLSPRPPDGYPASLRNIQESVPGQVEVGRFIKLNRDQFTLHPQTGFITLNTSLQNEQAIAVAYRVENGPGPTDDLFYGDFTNVVRDTSQRLVLKLVKPRNLIPQFKAAWNLMLKNIYPIGGRDIKKENFELNIYYQLPGREPQDNILQHNLLKLFRLDRTDEAGTGPADGKFDFIPGLTIDQARGEIIFPSLEPFREQIIKYFQENNVPAPADSFVYADVYDTTVTAARNNNAKDRFIIKGKYSAGVTSTYNLGFNLVDGSVEVLLDGRKLTPNTDYVIDYSTGQLIVRNEAALVPGANLQIRYEQNDILQLASKTLLGARGEYQLGPRMNLGFTMMNLNQQTLSDKVRLNEEPISNTILGIDASTNFEAGFLTRAINALPLIQTQVPSTITLRAEAAYMSPDPNTKKSPIPLDGGKGVAYIDDFEGIKRTIPLGTSYLAWHYASVPRYIDGVDPKFGEPLPDSVKMSYKAKTIWYNIIPSDVLVSEIWPQKTVAQGQEQVTVLNLDYDPSLRGEFNYKPLLADRRRNWGGLMRPLSATAYNLVDENINFIELWIKVYGNPRGGKMLIDLGQIDEDVIPNGKLDSEDGINPNFPVRNGILNDGEDVGIDGLTNAQERILYPNLGDDPSGDDWAYSTGSLDFTHINGTEGNGASESGRFPDTEDLNRNGIVDLLNSYFEYEVDLDTTGGAKRNPLIVGGGVNGWYQVRIPLIDYTRRVGEPSFSVVEFIRVWFTGMDEPVLVRVADFNLVGNYWQEAKKNDSTFSVTTVNLEDNLDYRSPPGVIRERDRTRPDQQIFANEQSMALVFKDIPDGESRQAFRYFSFRPLDVFNYRSMKMFVRGDPGLEYRDTSYYDLELFLRFGLDSLNYYEYRAPVHPANVNDLNTKGWEIENNVEIIFAEITSVKQGRDSARVGFIQVPVRGGPPGSKYGVRGNPTLTQIKFLAIGIENPLNKGQPGKAVSGQVWVNELRLSGVDDDPGAAYRVDAGIKLADLGSIGINVSKIDPTFHALDQRFGSRSTGVNWGVNASFSLERFLPQSWAGTTIPVSYSHVEGLSKPRYLPGTDVIVAEVARREGELAASRGESEQRVKEISDSVLIASQTLRVSDTLAAPVIRVQLPSQKWYIRDTFNRLQLGFNYNSISERTPIIASRNSWAWSGKLSYNVGFTGDNSIAPFSGVLGYVPPFWFFRSFRLYYTPSSLSWAVGAQRAQTREKVRTQEGAKPIIRNFTADRSFSFAWKLFDSNLFGLNTDYGLDVASSLVHLETDSAGNQRPFSRIVDDIFFGAKFIDFGLDFNYNQHFSLTPQIRVPKILSLDRFLDFTTNYRSDYRWQNNFQQGPLGKSSSVTSSFSLGLNFRLKQFTDPWFASGKTPASAVSSRPPLERRLTERERGEREFPPEVVEQKEPPKEQGQVRPEEQPEKKEEAVAQPQPAAGAARDTTQKEEGGGFPLRDIFRVLVKVPLLDFENINVNFSQQNSTQNNGLRGRTGFDNFWGRIPFFQKSLPENGPSRLYQLGFITDPSAEIKGIRLKNSFPFIGVDKERGLRAPNGNLVDNFTQSNKLDFKMSRELFRGFRIDLSWKVGWSYNRNETLTSDSLGVVTVRSVVTTGDVERSYFTFPEIFSIRLFKNDIAEVANKFEAFRADTTDRRPDEEKLAQAFEEGFETFPILKKVFGQFVPRANWTIRWDGLERFPYINKIASRVTLDHAYSSTFSRRWRGSLGIGQITESQRLTYGFTPFAGVNITFQDFFKGNFGATFRYNATTTYDLSTASRNIVETVSREISLSANFSRRGFAIPFFGLSLTNDIDMTLSYTYSRNSRKTFDVAKIEGGGIPLEGLSRTVLEPRIKYVLSTRVSASLFYRYTSVQPDRGASRIPGTKTNEAGLDIRITIQ